MIKNNFLLIKHDIYNGILCKWKYYVLAILLFSFVDFAFMQKVNLTTKTNMNISVSNLLINMFTGNEPFDIETLTGGAISIVWLCFFVLLFSAIAFYPTTDIKNSSSLYMLRVKSKGQWLNAKFVWCALTVIIYYLLFMIVNLVFSIISGKLSFLSDNNLNQLLNNISTNNVSSLEIFFSAFLLPLLISMALAFFEVTLSLIVKPIFSFMAVIFIMVVSSFYSNALLLLNYAMIIRTDFSAICGFDNTFALIVSLIVIVVCYASGLLIIRKKDLV